MEKEKELKGAFVERDLSWMYFNHRILQEAEKKKCQYWRECRSLASTRIISTSFSE